MPQHYGTNQENPSDQAATQNKADRVADEDESDD
jgi:hypothetical protein